MTKTQWVLLVVVALLVAYYFYQKKQSELSQAEKPTVIQRPGGKALNIL